MTSFVIFHELPMELCLMIDEFVKGQERIDQQAMGGIKSKVHVNYDQPTIDIPQVILRELGNNNSLQTDEEKDLNQTLVAVKDFLRHKSIKTNVIVRVKLDI
jgi:hypothetical protein